MGRKLTNITARKAIKAFERLGYEVARVKGSHYILKRAGFPALVIPFHKEVSPHLLKSQLKRAGIGVNEFLDNL